jgi:thiol-disulfide isomerase/thioredoxin
LNFGSSSDINDVIVPFINKFLNKSLPVNIRSLPEISEEEQTYPVVTVVGSTFNRTVLNNNNYVFMKFTAPWCHHCKKIKPEFDKIALDHKIMEFNNKNKGNQIIFGDFDATQNDVWPFYPVNQYPTLFLFSPPDKKQIQKCEYFYSPQKIRRFLNENIPGLELDVDLDIIKKEDEEKEEKERKEKEEKDEKERIEKEEKELKKNKGKNNKDSKDINKNPPTNVDL